jgi:endonuclease
MRQDYRRWLEQQKYDMTTVNAQMYRAARVEEYYGNLDEDYSGDRMASLIEGLRYSTDDERQSRPNPSKIPFDGNIRNNLASYRNAVERYRKFRDEVSDSVEVSQMQDVPIGTFVTVEEEVSQRIGLERDLQASLRVKIDQLEAGLTIIDDGAERSVESGFIDITARDVTGKAVVIELKAGVAGQRAVAQILSYMGDIASEEQNGIVRGILIASDFDAKAKAAARMVPALILRKYSVKFLFADGHG